MNYTCDSSISSSVTYQWLHNGTVLKNETSAFLSITNAQLNDTGEYYCIVTATNNVSAKSNSDHLTMPQPGEYSTIGIARFNYLVGTIWTADCSIRVY